MTTPHDTPRWVYLGGKMVQAKPDAPDHDSSPLYVLARDHAALVERCRVLEDAASLTRRADDLREVYHSLPNDRNRIGDKRSRKSHARDAWLRAFRKAANSARTALASGGRG